MTVDPPPTVDPSGHLLADLVHSCENRPSDEERAALLARADAVAVTELAERIIEVVGAPTVLAGPETGMVMLQVREPVVAERFHLGEVVVTRAEVDLAGRRGWAMRLGRDRLATLAAAVCDAAGGAGVLATDVEALCRTTAESDQARDRDAWDRLAPTTVRFEELD